MVLYILVQLLWFVSSAVTSFSPPICPTKCGQVDIPYPFGIGESDCFKNDSFNLTCNHSSTPPRPYWRGYEIQDISLLEGKMTVLTHVIYNCYDGAGNLSSNFSDWIQLPEDGPFTFSSTNQFTAIGCNTLGSLLVSKGGSSDLNFWSGACASTCSNDIGAINGSCDGMGCCKFEIPKAVKTFSATIRRIFSNGTFVSDFDHCGYSFLGD